MTLDEYKQRKKELNKLYLTTVLLNFIVGILVAVAFGPIMAIPVAIFVLYAHGMFVLRSETLRNKLKEGKHE